MLEVLKVYMKTVFKSVQSIIEVAKLTKTFFSVPSRYMVFTNLIKKNCSNYVKKKYVKLEELS